ncbi:MAG: amidohydrolase, partial [Chloroflexi bacterium]|nr:amidohydrolase [Chloroflexota bacterium]
MSAADLVLYNATVLTIDADHPRAGLVAVTGGRISHVGEATDLPGLQGADTRLVDCQGGTVIPGFHDAHLHLLGLASRLIAVNCTQARSMREIGAALASQAAQMPSGRWLRAWGYNEFLLPEGRHPSRHDLDSVSPDHPVRLTHRSGHAVVLNTPALKELGIGQGTPDPPYGVIERDEHGEPTGLLLEMDEWLDRRIPPLGQAELEAGVGEANRLLLSRGVTAVQDASVGNNLERWELLRGLVASGTLKVRVTFMPGLPYLADFLKGGLGAGASVQGVNIGPAKVVLSAITGAVAPPLEEVQYQVLQAHRAGFQVAIHAVEAEAVAEAAQIISSIQREAPSIDPRHRIEHCSECPPAVLERVKEANAVVVTNPGFLYHSGERYLSQVDRQTQPWLYRIGSLHRAGVTVAFGSDAPVEMPEPLQEIEAAVARRTASGRFLAPLEAVSIEEALRMHTLNASYAARQESSPGVIRQGMAADLVLLSHDPTRVEMD